jgi:hypothetical protein
MRGAQDDNDAVLSDQLDAIRKPCARASFMLFATIVHTTLQMRLVNQTVTRGFSDVEIAYTRSSLEENNRDSGSGVSDLFSTASWKVW